VPERTEKPGKVYLLGGGPGDPELITVRARRRVAEADVVLYDALIHPDLLQHARPDAEVRFVGKRAGRASERQSAINERMVEAARAGKTVARLKGGDPYLFGRGSEEAEYLVEHGIAFEVVPGVPSPLAATAYAGISLSHRELASSVAYLTATESPDKDESAHDWAKLATATQTLVIFMGLRKLDVLMELLMKHGRAPDCPAAVIHAASLPSQRTLVGTVSTIAELAREANPGMPSLIVVGEVVSLRQTLRWFDSKPLFGQRVLLTRPAEQGTHAAELLRDAGAAPVHLPAIRIEPPEDGAPLRDAVANLGDYDWVVFTSVNGVDRFFAELDAQDGDARKLGAARVAAIGPATAGRLASHGVRADVTPDEHRGEAVAEAILAHHDGHMHALSVLLPRAAIARDALPDALRQAGARVDVVSAYRTLPADETTTERLRAAIGAGEIDIATFTSSSTVAHTVEALGERAGELLGRLTVASIGPITTDTARKHGIRVDVTAERYTVEGLVEALEEHMRARAAKSDG
jgi:uroporphyrinogen III methyltransferase/synthase